MRCGRTTQSILFAASLALLAGAACPAIAQAACGERITVKAGDTLSSIAQRCGTTVGAFVRANPGLDPDLIYPDQTLEMPSRDSEEMAGRGHQTERYTIASGDTLRSIAKRLGTTVPAILAANPHLHPHVLPVGRAIVLPGGAPPGQLRLAGAAASISPDHGPVGTEVEVDARGLPPNIPVVIGGGPRASEYDVLKRAHTGRYGRVHATVAVPEHAGDDRAWVFVVTRKGPGLKAVSEQFRIVADRRGDEQAEVRVTGRLVNGVECPALRTDDGRRYALAIHELGRFKLGDRVEVAGEEVQLSFCQQGATIDVSDIRRAG